MGEPLALGPLIRDWEPKRTIPKDGTPITIAVPGATDMGWSFHEFPYQVCWDGQRWCFASTMAPLFPWMKPVRWRPGLPETKPPEGETP